MQIHELNTFSGTLGTNDFFATDNGTDTSKVSAENMFAPLNARIDNIIAGSAPSAEEIIDARLGVDGEVYPSLGDAVRGQVTDLKSDIDYVNAPILKGLDYSIEDGGYDTNGKKTNPSAYWLEQRTTAFSVDGVKSIEWNFECDTSVTQEGIWVVKWAKNGAFISRTQIHVQGVFFNAHGYYAVEDNVGFVAFVYGTRGYTVAFTVNANYDLEAIDNAVDSTVNAVFPKPQYTIEDGYYDANNGKKQLPSGYWSEQLTTQICVDNIEKVFWSFESDTLGTQNGIALSKWAKDGSFIERVTVQEAGTYSCVSGSYEVEDGVWFVAFHYSTRGYDCEFEVSDKIAFLELKDDVTELKSKLDSTDIIAGNQDAFTKVMASRWMEDDNAKPVSLLWFTDPHRKAEPLARIIEVKNYLKRIEMLDDTICTGDIILTSSEETAQFKSFWTDNSGTKDILIACGNHEWYANSSQPHTKMTIAQIDAMYFSDTSEWGIVRSGANPFYYKDYTDQKIRLIVVDPAVTDAEANETSWLSSVLADAITNEYAVVIATHFLRGNLAIYDNYWTEIDKRDLEVFTQGYDWAGCDIIACVSEFISNGGTFICYMQGHTHRDFLGYPEGHPEQLVVSLASASWGRSETPLRINDLPRFAGTRTEDCFNVISFDSNRKIVKCVRIGANVNLLEEPRTAFSYNYDTRQFISTI